MNASDLTIVIPTIKRWEILTKTLDALAAQTVQGFETIVVVDGDDVSVPTAISQRDGVRVLTQPHGGPGAARNTGVAASQRELILLLGDDMIPTPELVATHLATHNDFADPRVAVLGHVDWHPDVAGSRLQRWMDWSGTQFDYGLIDPATDAGFGRFFSCNVSLRRSLYNAADGFDPEFVYYYEDLDMGWRLEQQRMRLRYAPKAIAHHLHAYDWDALQRRFDGIVIGERMMAAKHPWFEPWFRQRMLDARKQPARSALWPRLADVIPDSVVESVPGARRVRRAIRKRANERMYQKLAPNFLWKWDGHEGLDELRTYLGKDFSEKRLYHHQHHVEAEEEAYSDELDFYRTSDAYLYDLTAFGIWETKVPYFEDLRRFLKPGARVLDYGCGIGTDGLRLIADGYRVGFADFDNPSIKYLRWRLDRRGLTAPVAEIFDVEKDVPGGFDVAYSFDVIEHVDDPMGFLDEMEQRADIVAVNLLEADPCDVHLHKELPIEAIRARAKAKGLLHYRKYHGRSHLLIYRAGAP